MRLIRAKDYNDVSRKAANIIAAQIYLKPDCVLGLATGSSPVGTYKELIAKYEAGDLDFSLDIHPDIWNGHADYITTAQYGQGRSIKRHHRVRIGSGIQTRGHHSSEGHSLTDIGTAIIKSKKIGDRRAWFSGKRIDE